MAALKGLHHALTISAARLEPCRMFGYTAMSSFIITRLVGMLSSNLYRVQPPKVLRCAVVQLKRNTAYQVLLQRFPIRIAYSICIC